MGDSENQNNIKSKACQQMDGAQAETGEGQPADKEPASEQNAKKTSMHSTDSSITKLTVTRQKTKRHFKHLVRMLIIARNWLTYTNQEEMEAANEEIDAELEFGNDHLKKLSSSYEKEATNEAAVENLENPFVRCGKAVLFYTVNPSRQGYYYWTTVVSVTCLYNLMMVIVRASFEELQSEYEFVWTPVDYCCDLIYLIDMLLEAKKGFLEQGIMVTDPKSLFLHYARTAQFALDFASIVPTNVLYLIWPHQPLVRINRILRCHRLSDFADQTETQTNFPNVFRICKLVAMIFIIFHWNACVYFNLSKYYGIGPEADNWVFAYYKIRNPTFATCDVYQSSCLERIKQMNGILDTKTDDLIEMHQQVPWEELNLTSDFTTHVHFTNLTRQYMFSFYWSALILTTIGEQVAPVTNSQFLFVIADILLGLLIFATIVGNVGSMISNMNAAEAEFQERLDGVKQFMEYRKVAPGLQKRVIQWFSYMRSQKQSLDEESVLESLPTKLKAEMAIQVHLETLKRVRIFQDCEPGLLVELVLKLKLQVFSPGDYICRKGDVGKEMYIVKRGSLNVVGEDGTTVFVTLKEGSVFGELSVLDIPGAKNGNRRTAGVRSVGYSDLFALSKDDLWDALKEYPEAKKLLLAKGREILRKDKLLDEEAPEEDVADLRSMDQRLDHVAHQLATLDHQFSAFYADLNKQTADTKKQLTDLERIFQNNKKRIKRDYILGNVK